MLSIERLELLSLEVGQVVELEHFQDAFECPVKQVFLDAAHLILFQNPTQLNLLKVNFANS